MKNLYFQNVDKFNSAEEMPKKKRWNGKRYFVIFIIICNRADLAAWSFLRCRGALLRVIASAQLYKLTADSDSQ